MSSNDIFFNRVTYELIAMYSSGSEDSEAIFCGFNFDFFFGPVRWIEALVFPIQQKSRLSEFIEPKKQLNNCLDEDVKHML